MICRESRWTSSTLVRSVQSGVGIFALLSDPETQHFVQSWKGNTFWCWLVQQSERISEHNPNPTTRTLVFPMRYPADPNSKRFVWISNCNCFPVPRTPNKTLQILLCRIQQFVTLSFWGIQYFSLTLLISKCRICSNTRTHTAPPFPLFGSVPATERLFYGLAADDRF